MKRVTTVWKKAGNFWREEAGQDLVEYALILALISLVIVVAAPPVRTAITTLFSHIATQLAPPSG
jgi:Flp pilus assembly pilin Flp